MQKGENPNQTPKNVAHFVGPSFIICYNNKMLLYIQDGIAARW